MSLNLAMDIGQAVREARKSIGLTQETLGLQAGVSRRAVILLEGNGGRVDTLEKATVALGLRITGLPPGATIGAQIAQARANRKLTQSALAEAAGVSIPTIREVENGRGLVTSVSAVLAVLAPEARRRKHPRAHWAKVTDERFTPPAWLEAIEQTLGPISIDPCSDRRSFVRAERYLSQADDGLLTPWTGRLAFVNPPYSENSTWIHRCADAWQKGEVETVVALFPSRTETAAFHDRVFGHADVIFLRGKPRFFNEHGARMSIAPFAAVLVVWGGAPQSVANLAKQIGGTTVWAEGCLDPLPPCGPVSRHLATE